MSKTSDNVPLFGRNFLEEIDQYISRSYDVLTCNDVWKIYFQFYEDMKIYKGNSNGFTGLSEYLLFRVIYHFFGGSFDPIKITNDSYEFVSKSDPNLCLSQGTRVCGIKERRLYPDIGVYFSKQLLAVCQIKIYLTNGAKEVHDELEKLIYLKNYYPDLHALLLFFTPVSPKGKIIADLKSEVLKNQWFQHNFLKGNNQVLINVLKEGLKLDRIPIAKMGHIK